jgi:hypothetical protein
LEGSTQLKKVAAIKDIAGKLFPTFLPGMIFLASLVCLSLALLKGWNGAIHDLHPFRQTQTAITVTYLLKGGPWLAYETPVLGPPWSIPLEFPLYQWLVALTALTGIFPVEQSGRLISVLMFLATFYPFYKILKALGLQKGQIFLVLTLYCLSPEYLFWSRTFMIESTAFAFSMYYLMGIVMFYDKPIGKRKGNYLLLVSIAFAGALAAMVKVTTFYAFLVAGVAFFLWRSFSERRETITWRDIIYSRISLTFFFFAMLVPLVALSLWTSYADALKSLNPLARNLTSTALWEWNFGTLSQRLSPRTWEMFFNRTVPDLIGNRWLLAIAVPAVFFCRRQPLIIASALFALFLLPLVTFTNLHFRHNYYAYANGVFLVAAIGVISADLCYANQVLKRAIGIVLFCCVLTFSPYHYLTHYFPKQGVTGDLGAIKNDMDKILAGEDKIIVVFGADWSSELPYYLGRRAVMFSSTDLNSPSFREMLHNLAPYRVGAILFLGETRGDATFIKEALRAFGFHLKLVRNYFQMLACFNS